MICDCGREAEEGTDTCFRCRIRSVRFGFQGGALVGRSGWNRTREEHMLEHLGTTDDRELAKRGIERAKP